MAQRSSERAKILNRNRNRRYRQRQAESKQQEQQRRNKGKFKVPTHESTEEAGSMEESELTNPNLNYNVNTKRG